MFKQNVEQLDLWRGGSDGYHSYRIPALAVSKDQTILAFCEGRKQHRGDFGDIALLVKRSTDGGVTWSSQSIVWDDPGNTSGNPAPVVDRSSGAIHLLMTWNRGDDHERDIIAGSSQDTRRVYATSSTDDGLTWSTPKEITGAVKQSDWTWYATGPGHGIQMRHGEHCGRLVIPCDHIEAGSNDYYSHIIYSDDNGASWKLGGRAPQPQVNECEVAEISGGRLLLNMRSYAPDARARQVAFSADGGITWSDQRADPALVEPICQASILAYPDDQDGPGGTLLFANPASASERVNLTLRGSRDEGAAWPGKIALHAGPSAYSDLAVAPDGRILCLYEGGEAHPYEYLRLAFVELE
jgi:sialidase-1